MNEIELISRLARKADEERCSDPDVTDRVLAALRRGDALKETRLWRNSAMVLMVLAIVACVVAADSWSSLLNPLSEFGDSQTAAVTQ